MKSIVLAEGKEAIVDDEDFDALRESYWWWWHKDVSHPIGYAQGQDKRTRKHVYMHRIVAERMGMDIAGRLVDHRNLDTLFNVRANLRVATHSQSQHNKGVPRNNKSGFKGVSWVERIKRWNVQISVKGKAAFRGHFRHEKDAQQVRLLMLYLHHGEFANNGEKGR